MEKPSHRDGTATRSIQFFDREGAAALKVFLNFDGPIQPERLARVGRHWKAGTLSAARR